MTHFASVKTTFAIVFAAGLVALPGTPAGAAAKRAAYFGEWGLDAESCKSGDAELKIAKNYWGSVDFECQIKSVSGGKGVWRVKLHKCQGEGIGKTESVTIRASASNAKTSYAGDSFSNDFIRCP